ncbi:two-component sensor histidine kinase [Photobacterium jeanii]|uniref:C4-dicarboxylate transport sensor protein DctB n=2 Tax=Photobacterium jeanii TaxID=858640 RepID=A0A178K3K0_9GAMM|nr:ATP-binding protein [Photobacterium jeanii]OAN11676.1 two-component sensor histidine kinase [Photobacterium jeanii]PST91209.1 sensor histidine kinase [Photobacterium jeanii]
MVLAFVGVVLCSLVSMITYQQVKQHLSEQIINDVSQLGEKLDAQLSRYSQVPQVLANDPRLQFILTQTHTATSTQGTKTNQLLESWANTLGADVLYLINTQGETLAASNWQSETSFVGQNYSYRPYFIQAMAGATGQYFALGVSSDKRGYYFSAPVYQQDRIIGVLALKVDLSLIEDIWDYDQVDYAIVDQHGIIFYSSEASWLYRALIQLPDNLKQQIIASRQYGNAPLSSISKHSLLNDFKQRDIAHITHPTSEITTSMLVSTHEMAEAGWAIYGFSPINTAYQYVIQAVMIFTVFYLLLCLAIVSWMQTSFAQRQLALLNDKLEQLVIERTRNLMETNQALRDTIHQYELTQAELKQAHSELIQAAKLAMLGELSASINHEINQPLAAMRTYAENSRKLLAKERYEAVAGNIDEIISLNQMIADIIARFKVFARKTTDNNNRTVVADSIRSATSLLRNKLIKHGVILRVAELPPHLVVNIDAVQFEQVLINLLHNAIQALDDAHPPQIGVDFVTTAETVAIHIWDNGPGLDDELKNKIFNPFYTSKPDGLGLGLTISRRIIDAFAGTITVENHSGGGCEFIISLPRSNEEGQ